MERRNRSLKALKELMIVDSLEDDQRAQGLRSWVEKYLQNTPITDFNLPLEELKQLSELFYKNTAFLKRYRENQRIELAKIRDMKKFLH